MAISIHYPLNATHVRRAVKGNPIRCPTTAQAAKSVHFELIRSCHMFACVARKVYNYDTTSLCDEHDVKEGKPHLLAAGTSPRKTWQAGYIQAKSWPCAAN
jgi:hypothetical protein